MKKIIISLLLPLFLVSCDHIGSTHVKNLIDLTDRLQVESSESFIVDKSIKNISLGEGKNSYRIAKNKIIADPAIASGVMYSIDNKGYVSAFSLKEKKLLWVSDIAKDVLDRNFANGGILFSNGKLYITNSSKYLFVLDAKSGHEIIRKEFPDIVRSKPAMTNNNLVLVQTISNQLVAFDIESYKLSLFSEGGIETISTVNYTSPLVYNNHVLASFTSGEVVYLDASNGKEKWRYDLSRLNDIGLRSFQSSVIVARPIISDNYVYFATSNGSVIKIDLDNGAPVWVKKVEDVQSLSLISDYLFVTNNARQIASLSAHNGKIAWVGDLISVKDRAAKRPKVVSFQSPFVANTESGVSLNVIASNGELYQFKLESGGEFVKSPKIITITKGVLYHWISCCSGGLHLITKDKVKF